MLYLPLIATYWTVSILLGMALIVVIIGILRNRSFKRKHDLFQKFADSHALGLAFQNPFHFTFFGNNNTLAYRIEPYRGLMGSGGAIKGAIFTLPLINPELKALKISKSHPEYPWIDSILPIDDPIKVGHVLGEGISITANDMVFTSFILTQDIIIDLGVLFNRVDAGVVFIYGDQLGCIIPHMLYEENMYETWEKALELLHSIKMELQV